ncbi:MAG: hypothetical protein ABIP43_02675 [Nitrospiraceae bacterium]
MPSRAVNVQGLALEELRVYLGSLEYSVMDLQEALEAVKFPITP